MTGLFGSSAGGSQAAETYGALVIAAGRSRPLAGRKVTAAAEAAETMLDEYGFDVETTAAEVGEALHERLAGLAGVDAQIRLVIIVGRLGVGCGRDLAADVGEALDHSVPGLAQSIRRAQLDAGYSRSVFESPACGWIGGTLVLTLPDDVTGVQAAIQEVGAIILDVLDELREDAEEAGDDDTGGGAVVHDLRPKVVPLNRSPDYDPQYP
ncbi:hypothetical protein M3B11_05975 [Brevibacterium sp. p3-SID960]|uniref:hypothetical protein n=1 Tax=Brevibacterium sp. p3-SID960 TaxID=2916063 RepID=UPI0021A46F1C|nr:hypothetical protein [Brevibacterium sp. p3-SID960]MCT1690501.1 hypothetical protein [Brevibacterium sp. p3-SID960]